MPFLPTVAQASSLNFWDLIAQSSFFALLVLLILVFMSLVSWAIIIAKYRLFSSVTRNNDHFIRAFRKRRRLQDAIAKTAPYKASPMYYVLENGLKDLEHIVQTKKGEGNLQAGLVKLDEYDLDAIEKTLDRSANEKVAELEKYTIFLASTGNSAPYFGLLGTCWGVMSAFMNIGVRGSASLAVVAPGIAEALIATIVGLAAAIPAVIAHNWASSKLRSIGGELENFELEFLSAVQKENEF